MRSSLRPQGEAELARRSLIDRFDVIRTLPLFWGVTAAAREKILSAAEQKTVCDAIFSEGAAVQKVTLLLSGCVKVTRLTLSGDEVILRLCGEGDLLGTFDMFRNGQHSSTAQPMKPCQVINWPVQLFQQLVESFPTFRRNVLQSLEERLRELEDRFVEVAHKNVAARLSSELIRLSHRLGDPANGGDEICLSRQELAKLTATTLYTVSRLLCQWQRLGIVRARKGVVQVRDLPALRQLAEGQPE